MLRMESRGPLTLIDGCLLDRPVWHRVSVRQISADSKWKYIHGLARGFQHGWVHRRVCDHSRDRRNVFRQQHRTYVGEVSPLQPLGRIVRISGGGNPDGDRHRDAAHGEGNGGHNLGQDFQSIWPGIPFLADGDGAGNFQDSAGGLRHGNWGRQVAEPVATDTY